MQVTNNNKKNKTFYDLKKQLRSYSTCAILGEPGEQSYATSIVYSPPGPPKEVKHYYNTSKRNVHIYIYNTTVIISAIVFMKDGYINILYYQA